MFKKVVIALLISSMTFGFTSISVNADESVPIDYGYESNVQYQLQSLYDSIGNKLGVNPHYIELIHLISKNSLEYSDELPNIYLDLTADKAIKLGDKELIYQKADFINLSRLIKEDESPYYIPDALYSLSYDIISIMGQRYNYNRGGLQQYFNALTDEVKLDIVFYESVLLYTGEDEDAVNKFYSAYEKIMYDKQLNESIVDDNNIFKDKYAETLMNIGLENLDYLALLMKNNLHITENDSIESVKTNYTLPYKLNYTSRENLLIAASSLVGNVRYIWGGGHGGSADIDGINPLWEICNNAYLSNENTAYKCIKPSGSWCIKHGYSDSLCNSSIYIESSEDYLTARAKILSDDEMLLEKYNNVLNSIDYESNNINEHSLDGLDCSGYISWVYNQITDKYIIDSSAYYFDEIECFDSINIGDEMLPGDIFAWKTHIVLVVGKVAEGSKAYVTLEQTPNIVKFGVLYYKDATEEDILLAKQIATEATTLIGGVDCEKDRIASYCIDNVRYYTEIIDEQEKISEYSFIGRFKDQFIDEDSVLNESDKKIKDMLALDIIKYTLTKLPISYIRGFNVYEESLFLKEDISSNVGVNIENIFKTESIN